MHIHGVSKSASTRFVHLVQLFRNQPAASASLDLFKIVEPVQPITSMGWVWALAGIPVGLPKM